MKRSGGFTLIELMIVVVIVAILAAIGYPAYQSQMEEARLSEGRTALTRFATELERCYSRFGRYDHPDCDAYAAADNDKYYSENDTYKIIVGINSGGNGYNAVALRQKVKGPNECGNLYLSHTGEKKVASTTTPAEECW